MRKKSFNCFSSPYDLVNLFARDFSSLDIDKTYSILFSLDNIEYLQIFDFLKYKFILLFHNYFKSYIFKIIQYQVFQVKKDQSIFFPTYSRACHYDIS